MRIYLPNMGFPSAIEAEEQREELRRMRAFEGTGGPFIPVPGLLSLDRVATRGLVLQDVITRDMPIAPAMQQTFPLTVDCCSLIQGADGTPLLFRHPWSNDGAWQPGEVFHVFGTWDTEIAPEPEMPLRPLEPVHRPILTSGEVTGEGEVRIRAGKVGKE